MQRRPTEEPSYTVTDRRWWAREAALEGAAAEGGSRPAERKPSYVEELERQLSEKDQKLRETREIARRASTEFEQARGRLEREAKKAAQLERRAFLGAFLEVLDDLDRALDAARDTGTGSALREGVELVRQRFLALLEKNGVSRLECRGERFDPVLHEAVSTVPVDDPARDSTVVEVVRPGYRAGDETLRPAMVVVGRRS